MDLMQRISYDDPFTRPDVEVEVDGVWHPGELREWLQADDGTWSASVVFHVDHITHSGRFPSERVREDTVDRSRGRG